MTCRAHAPQRSRRRSLSRASSQSSSRASDDPLSPPLRRRVRRKRRCRWGSRTAGESTRPCPCRAPRRRVFPPLRVFLCLPARGRSR
eukprot:4017103-Prymnesium_polylepis.2